MFGWLRSAFDWASGKIDDTIRAWVHDLISGLYTFLHIIFGDVGKAWSELERGVYDLWHVLDVFGRQVVKVADELFAWINHEGRTLWHYITHPNLIVDLIWRELIVKIEREAWDVTEVLGKFFLSLFHHHMKRFLLLMEDILHAVL
jgi:hypothetical protein